MHYRDAHGVYRPIDTTVDTVRGRAGFSLGNTTNAYTSLFGARSDRLVRFEAAGRHVELGLPGAPVAVAHRVDGSTVTYPGAADGADLVYEVDAGALKEKIVLRRAAGRPASSYTFTVKSGGVDPVRARRRLDRVLRRRWRLSRCS